MERKTKETPPLQWHPAFYAGIQIELAKEAEKLTFENEHQLGTKPKEIDVLIIKKNSEDIIQKNIGRIFRKYNIIEYKSPDDYLSIDDYYKVCGYACFYKSDVPTVDEIKSGEITLTFVCRHHPRRLMKHLEQGRGLHIEQQEKGIYYICGDNFPIQLIVTAELPKESNFWLRNLTNDLQEKEEVQALLSEYQGHKHEGVYKSVMNVITRANREKIEEVNRMCGAPS